MAKRPYRFSSPPTIAPNGYLSSPYLTDDVEPSFPSLTTSSSSSPSILAAESGVPVLGGRGGREGFLLELAEGVDGGGGQ